MSGFKRFIGEIHRRSLWQVLAVYVATSWLVLEAADVLVDRLALPDWVYGVAIVLLLVGLPIVLATAFVQEGLAHRATPDPTLLPGGSEVEKRVEASGAKRLLTWRNAISGGVIAFALWGVVATVMLLTGSGRESGDSAVAAPAADVVAILPFRTSGAESGLDYLREGMMDLLAAKLTGEGGPRAADPRSVMSALNRASDSDGRNLSEGIAADVARSVGAGLVLLGGIVGTPDRLVINASLLGVGPGPRHAQATVEGPVDSLTALVDELAAELLAREAGEAEHRLAALTSTSLPALRAYLDGQADYRRGAHAPAAEHFQRAIELDSTFALAAIGRAYSTYWTAQRFDPQALELAWQHRDRLSERDRAALLSVTGPNYPEPPTGREALQLAERAVELSPERAEAWYWLGEIYYHDGAALALDDPWERAEAAFARAVELDSAFVNALFHLTDVAGLRGDTAAMRRRGELYFSIGSSSAAADIIAWLMARTLGDSARLAAVHDRFPDMSEASLRAIARQSQLRGLSLADADRAVATLGARLGTRAERWDALSVEHDLRLNQGRPQAALEVTHRMPEVAPNPVVYLVIRVLDGLVGEGDPAAAARAAQALESYASSLTTDSTVSQAELAALCVPALWRLTHGDTADAAQVPARLREVRPDLRPGASLQHGVCLAVIEAMLAEIREDRGPTPQLERLDSLMRDDPQILSYLHSTANLTAARLLEGRGEPERALATVRRRRFYPTSYLAAHLREEGRLAALTGDRAGAARAYRHYLTLRARSEPALATEVERVRAELDRLIEEGAGR